MVKVEAVQKLAWWRIAYGKLDRQMQGDFERAQKLAIERGQSVSFTLTVTIEPPDPKEPEYIDITYKRSFKEPAYKSSNNAVVMRNGVAVADAEQHPDQGILELDDKSDIGRAKAVRAAS